MWFTGTWCTGRSVSTLSVAVKASSEVLMKLASARPGRPARPLQHEQQPDTQEGARGGLGQCDDAQGDR